MDTASRTRVTRDVLALVLAATLAHCGAPGSATHGMDATPVDDAVAHDAPLDSAVDASPSPDAVASLDAAADAPSVTDAVAPDDAATDAVVTDAITADVVHDGGAAAPRHVLTWDYYGGPLGASPTAVPAATAAPWLSWADSSDPALIAAGVKTYLYSSPLLLIAPSDEFYATLVESDFAHTCAGSTSADRVTLHGYANSNVTDPRSPHLAATWASWVNGHTARHDLIFMEAADIYWEPVSAAPCMATGDDWLAGERGAVDRLVAAVRYPTRVIFNGLWPARDATGAWGLPHTMPLFDDPNVAGARMEGCFIEPYNPMVNQKIPGDYWAAQLSTEIAIARRGRMMLCMSGWNAPTLVANAAIDQRLYSYASFLLGYDPALTMIGQGFSTPSNFRVEPETQLVALHPVLAAPADAAALLTHGALAGGLFVREYADCYFAGARVGRCAAVVNNDTAHPHPFAAVGAYHHTLALTGGGVLPSDGGSASVAGPPPPAMVPAMTGLIALE